MTDPKHTIRDDLRHLSDHQLADVLLEEFDRRRLDAQQNPIPGRDGLYEAATMAMLGLLGLESRNGMVQRLGDVGLGARLNRKDQDVVNAIRQLALEVEAAHRSLDPGVAAALAMTLSQRFGRQVTEQQIARALRRREASGRIADVAIVLGLLPRDDRTLAIRRVKLAIAEG